MPPPNPPPALPAMPAAWPDTRRTLLDPTAADDAALLANIQANILQGHGRRQATLIFWRYKGSAVLGEGFWAGVAARVTSAAEQWRQAAHRATEPHTILRSFAVTAAGMHALGVAEEKDRGRAMVNNPAKDETFASFNAAVNPLPPLPKRASAWAKNTVHGLWLVACASKRTLAKEVSDLRAWGASHGLVTTKADVEPLTTWWNPKTKLGREAFGFADGISVPVFVRSAAGSTPTGGTWASMPLAQVLVEPGMSVNERHTGGAFLIVQKLEQNVRAFRAFEAAMKRVLRAVRPRLPAAVCHEPGALLVGRHRNGQPLAAPDAGPAEVDPRNRFTFEGDPQARRCPFHAHIRKLNPRTETPSDPNAPSGQTIRQTQLVRRGMIYDPGKKLRKPWPRRGVGLMFMAYTSYPGKTFDELVKNWTINSHIPAPSGHDPILAGAGQPWNWAGGGVTSPGSLAQFVTPLGGGYFFVPPIRWLRALAGPPES